VVPTVPVRRFRGLRLHSAGFGAVPRHGASCELDPGAVAARHPEAICRDDERLMPPGRLVIVLKVLSIGVIGGGIIGVIAGVIVALATGIGWTFEVVFLGCVVIATAITLVWAIKTRQ